MSVLINKKKKKKKKCTKAIKVLFVVVHVATLPVRRGNT